MAGVAPAGAVSVSKVQVAPRRGVVIATIDLERIFQAYPGTKKAKEELEKLILIKENEIAGKRAEIFRLTEELARLKTQSSSSNSAPPPPSTATPQSSTETLTGGSTAAMDLPGFSQPEPAAPNIDAGAEQAAVNQKEAELKTKKEELRRMEREAEKNLEALEEAKTKTLLAKIYFAVRELAEEKNVDVVVDKNAILWGASKLDLTDELLRKLKSAMIERE